MGDSESEYMPFKACAGRRYDIQVMYRVLKKAPIVFVLYIEIVLIFLHVTELSSASHSVDTLGKHPAS